MKKFYLMLILSTIAFFNIQAQAHTFQGHAYDKTGGVAVTAPTPKLVVNAYPNPSFGEFNIAVSPSSDRTALMIRILTARGRVVQVIKNVSSFGDLRIGAELKPGTYYAEITQGQKKVMLRLLKM
jgi:hypothetical protein